MVVPSFSWRDLLAHARTVSLRSMFAYVAGALGSRSGAGDVTGPHARSTDSTALGALIFLPHPMIGKATPFLSRMHAAMGLQVALIRALVGDLFEDPHGNPPKPASALHNRGSHNSSVRSCDGTNGVSPRIDSLVPRSTPIHTRAESIRMVATMMMNR